MRVVIGGVRAVIRGCATGSALLIRLELLCLEYSGGRRGNFLRKGRVGVKVSLKIIEERLGSKYQ